MGKKRGTDYFLRRRLNQSNESHEIVSTNQSQPGATGFVHPATNFGLSLADEEIELSDYDGADRNGTSSKRLYLAINSLNPGVEGSTDMNSDYFSNQNGRLCIRNVRVPQVKFSSGHEGYGYVPRDDYDGPTGNIRNHYLFEMLMRKCKLSGRKQKMEWGISEVRRHEYLPTSTSPNGNSKSHIVTAPTSVDELPEIGAQDSLKIPVLTGDKNINNPLRKAFGDIVRSTNRVLATELGDERHYELCIPILRKADEKDSKVARSLVSMTAQILIRARQAADAAGKSRSEQSCLAVGMVILQHLAREYITEDTPPWRKVDEAFSSFNIKIERVGRDCYSPKWLDGVIKTYDEVIEYDSTAEIYCKFYTLAYIMFIMWARYDRISFKPQEVELRGFGPWTFLKAVTDTGEAPKHPLGVPDNLVACSSKDRTQIAPWVATLLMAVFNADHKVWKWFLLCLAVLTLCWEIFRRYSLGTSRRKTFSLPISICDLIESKTKIAVKARDVLGGDSSQLMLGHRDLGQTGSFNLVLRKLIGDDRAKRSFAVSFRGAFIGKNLHIEDLRANANVLLKIRIAKDAYKSHLNKIEVVPPGSDKSSWHDSAGFIYATKSIYRLVVYDEWVLSIPFY